MRNNIDMGTLLRISRNPDKVFQEMLKSNQQFAKFVEENKGRSPEEIAKAYGLSPDIIKQL